MGRSLQQSLVKLSGSLSLAFARLKVDVRLLLISVYFCAELVQSLTFQTISGMSRLCCTASSKIARTRSKSSTALSTCVHWIQAELKDGSYCKSAHD